MNEQPDPSAFSVSEKPNEYRVRCRVSGEVTLTINAESKEAARAEAEAMVESEPGEFELFEPAEVDIEYVSKTPPMYRVTRDGAPMQVSRLCAGDLPREPDERGF